MTDKEKIRAEVERRRNIVNNSALQMKGVNIYYHYSKMVEEYDDILRFVNSLPEEPVSEDLNEAAQNALNFTEQSFVYDDPETKEGMMEVYTREQTIAMFKFGAQWQKEQMMAEAIDTVMVYDDLNDLVPGIEDLSINGYTVGEKVKVIIIKDE